jgi:hypothetical protein
VLVRLFEEEGRCWWLCRSVVVLFDILAGAAAAGKGGGVFDGQIGTGECALDGKTVKVLCVCVCVCACVCVCMYVCMYVCMCVCACVLCVSRFGPAQFALHTYRAKVHHVVLCSFHVRRLTCVCVYVM